MAYSAPPTKSVGNTLAAADWNTYIRDNMIDLAARLLPTASVQVLTDPSDFTTTSTSYVDVTGATVTLTTTRQSTILLMASGWIRADLATYTSYLVGTIGATTDTNPIKRDCANTTYDYSFAPFGYTWWLSGVAAGATVVKLQLKSSSGSMTARCGNINLIAIGIPEA